MSTPSSTTERVQSLLAELKRGDDSAEGRLLQVVHERFRILARQMLRRYQRIRHLEDTDDLLQRTWMRLHGVLKTFRPESPHVFFAISAKHMRWELIDLARSYQRENCSRLEGLEGDVVESRELKMSTEPLSLDDWAQFHQAVEGLPEQEKEVVSLLYYQGITQESAADLMGMAVRTVKLRWQSAKLHISRKVQEKTHE